MRRVVSPERASRLKSMDPVAASREARTREVLRPSHDNAMTLDISAISSQESARLILEHIETRSAAGSS